MKKYFYINDPREANPSAWQAFKRTCARCCNTEVLAGLWAVITDTLKFRIATVKYPMQKVRLDARYRAVHRLQRFIDSGAERCIGCGLCEKICISNCIRMETALGDDGRKKVSNYSINLGRCIYCGFCAEVCPELAIVHGREYEWAAEQRAYFAHKSDLLTPIDKLLQQEEFEGSGALRKDADEFVKKTPNYYDLIIAANAAAAAEASAASDAVAAGEDTPKSQAAGETPAPSENPVFSQTAEGTAKSGDTPKSQAAKGEAK